MNVYSPLCDSLITANFVFSSYIGLVSLFDGISTFIGYLMPKPSF